MKGTYVAIHNKNGKGLLQKNVEYVPFMGWLSQSTIKMEKGYYVKALQAAAKTLAVAIHNKNGKGLLLK